MRCFPLSLIFICGLLVPLGATIYPFEANYGMLTVACCRPTAMDTLPAPSWRTANPPTPDFPLTPVWRTFVPPISEFPPTGNWPTTDTLPDSNWRTAELPPTDSLHAALDTFLDRQLEAQLAEFDASKKGNWMYYLPSVGIGYTPITRTATDGNLRINSEPRPTVSFSLGQVLTARRRKQDIEAKRSSLQAKSQLEREQAHRNLDRLLQRHALLLLELETMRRTLDIDRQLFVLIQADYDDAKISPQQFLPKQKALLEAELRVMRKEMEVGKVEGEILALAHL